MEVTLRLVQALQIRNDELEQCEQEDVIQASPPVDHEARTCFQCAWHASGA